MYIRLWNHMHIGMGRRMHLSMYISIWTKHFRMATEVWSMYMMMGPMSGKVTLSGPFIGSLPTLQLLKLALEDHYRLMMTCRLILQGAQPFPPGPDLICKAIRVCGGGGGHGSQGALSWRHRRLIMRLRLLVTSCLNCAPARYSVSRVSWARCSSASMVLSWIFGGRMDGSARVVAAPAVEPVLAAAHEIGTLSSST